VSEPDERAGAGPSLASGSALMFVQQTVGNAGFFVSVLLLARGLGPSGRGAIAFYVVVALITARVFAFGVWEATTVYAAQRPERRSALLTNVAMFSICSALVGAALSCSALLVAGDARPDELGNQEIAALALGIVATSLFEAGFAFMLGNSRFRETALFAAALPWSYALILILILIGPGLTVANAAIAWTASAVLGATLMLFASTRQARPGAPDLSLLAESISFGVRAWIGTLSRFLNFRLDQILLAVIASEAALGIYAVAVNVSEVLLYLPSATATALLPVAAASESSVAPERTLRAFRAVALISVAAMVIALLAGPPLLPLVFGERFEPAVLPFILLLPGTLGYAASAVFSSALAAASSPGLSSVGPLISLVAGLALDVVLIPPFGAPGAAAAASAAFLIGGGVAGWLYLRRTGSAWQGLIPRRGDFAIVRDLAAKLKRRVAGENASGA
jgi:O-antigen/teichoic acid export membrane protein